MERTRQTATKVNTIRPQQNDEPASDRRSLAATSSKPGRGDAEPVLQDVGVAGGSMSGKGGVVNTGDLPGQDVERHPAEVRAAIVVSKSGNADGAKGGRKTEPSSEGPSEDQSPQVPATDKQGEEALWQRHKAQRGVWSEKMLLAVTEELIRETLEYAAEEKKSKDIKPIREIKKYIEENYMEEISLGQLAELVDMNASYLSSVFKKETGMTYSEYLILCRVKQASRLLVETNLSIGEIAHQSGYQDARYFSKQFSKQVGLKPSEYRKLYS